MVKQKESLADKRKQDITLFCDQAYKIQEWIHHSQVILTDEIYKMRLMMERMKVIVMESLAFRKGLLDIAEKVKIQMAWRETNSKFPDHLPHKTTYDLKLEMVLLEFCRKASRRINNEIPKTIEKFHDFYKKIHQVHEKCHNPLVQSIVELPKKDQCIEQLQDGLQEDLEYIKKWMFL